MGDTRHDEALGAIEEIFGDRAKRSPVGEVGPGNEGAWALVSPVSAEEVELLVEVAGRFSVPLAGLGAGTAREAGAREGSVLVRFDLMSGMRFSDSEDLWVEAEPGALWLELDNNLQTRGQSLAVYPTSAPRATVGGWLAQDGLGVGSYEYGWLSENVLSVDVVFFEGGRRTVRGTDLRGVLGAGGDMGLAVSAVLRTRRADADVPFGVFFDAPENFVRAVSDIIEISVPLWHLAFVDPGMARARGLEEGYLLFGAYPGERAAGVEEALGEVFGSRGGRVLPNAEAYRAWGERFFPVAPSRPTPIAEHTLVSLTELAEVLPDARARPETTVVQGTVARSGEVLLLNIEDQQEGRGR